MFRNEINAVDEAQLKKKEEAYLKRVDEIEATRRRNELMQQKQLQLYKDVKAKRLKKIKSKVYRALKKRKRTKDESKKLEMLAEEDPALFLAEVEKNEKDRARERITLRHRNKTKFTEQLRRFADDKDAQKVYADLNRERRKILKKMNLEDYEELGSSDSDYEHVNVVRPSKIVRGRGDRRNREGVLGGRRRGK
jgi:U3 small nucleolar RNA-associated protein 14